LVEAIVRYFPGRVVTSTIPEAVPVEDLAPETREATGAAPEPAEVASEGAPAIAEEERDNVLPESNLEVVVRSIGVLDRQTYQGGTRGSRL
jgi:hypothetical protein